MTRFTRTAIAATTATALIFSTIAPGYAQFGDGAPGGTPGGNENEETTQALDAQFEANYGAPGAPDATCFDLTQNQELKFTTEVTIPEDASIPDDQAEAVKTALNTALGNTFGVENVTGAEVTYSNKTLTFTIPKAVADNAKPGNYSGLSLGLENTVLTLKNADSTYEVNKDATGAEHSNFTFNLCEPEKKQKTEDPKHNPGSSKENNSDVLGKVFGGIIGSIFGLSLLGLLLCKLMPKHAPTAPVAPVAPKTPVKGIVKGIAKNPAK